MRSLRAPALAALALLALSPAQAQTRSWTEEKCVRYEVAWREALRRYGEAGLSREFLDRHNAFVAGGCTGTRDVCPRSERELELANVLTIRAMNAGTASTFLPFACRR